MSSKSDGRGAASLRTEVDDCSGAFILGCSRILPAVDSQLGTFMSIVYEACRGNVMSLHCNNDRNVDCTMDEVPRKLLCFPGSVKALCTRTRLPPLMGPGIKFELC